MMSLADLSDELLDLIVSGDVNEEFCGLKGRSVCKSWEAIASRLYPPYPLPCLIYYDKDDGNRGRWNLFRNNGTFSSAKIPELEDANLLYSKHQCLLMSRHTYKLFIFKLSTNQNFQIPKSGEIYKNISFINQPGSPDCSIVGVTALRSSTPRVSIGVLKWGEDKWNHYKHGCKQFEMSSCAPILHRGLLYCLDIQGNIGTFDIEKPANWTVYNNCLKPAHLQRKIHQIYFVKLEEEGEEALFTIFRIRGERKLYVYKLLESDMKWKPVVSLGDKILFVGRAASFGGKALFKSEANRIYFHNKELFYCLDSQEFLPFDGENTFSHYKGCVFEYFNHAVWIDRPPTNFLELFK